jgi:hypothetical protein
MQSSSAARTPSSTRSKEVHPDGERSEPVRIFGDRIVKSCVFPNIVRCPRNRSTPKSQHRRFETHPAWCKTAASMAKNAQRMVRNRTTHGAKTHQRRFETHRAWCPIAPSLLRKRTNVASKRTMHGAKSHHRRFENAPRMVRKSSIHASKRSIDGPKRIEPRFLHGL